jgi:AbrB family looped-hinge helix DNA binding protein
MNTVKLHQRGVLTLPKKIRESLELKEGEILTVSQEDDRIILERANGGDIALFRDIKKSLMEIKQGKFIEFGSISEFKKKMKEYDAH